MITRIPCLLAAALALGTARLAMGEAHVAKGLTVELVAAEQCVVPGKPLTLGVVLKPDSGYHTYWRQPGIVGLSPTIEWKLPPGFKPEETLFWPEPQRGLMGVYGVWCLKREAALVIPVSVPADLDPKTAPTVTLKAKLVWMACGRTCHPGAAELSLTLPVCATPPKDSEPTAAARLIAQTMEAQPVQASDWSFAAVQHGNQGGFSLTVTPPTGRTVPADAYFFGHQRLVDSNVEPVRRNLPDGRVCFDLALVETPDAIAAELVGELWSADGWKGGSQSRLLAVRAPLIMAPEKE